MMMFVGKYEVYTLRVSQILDAFYDAFLERNVCTVMVFVIYAPIWLFSFILVPKQPSPGLH
jgi:hypothetical protein